MIEAPFRGPNVLSIGMPDRAAARPRDARVFFPRDALPCHAAIHTRHAVSIAAPPEIVWAWLIRAGRWREWFDPCREVRFRGSSGPDLAPGALFRWTLLGVQASCHVEEFRPERALAWSATMNGGRAYYGWLLDRAPRGGTRVVSEQTHRGFRPRLLRWFLGYAHERAHDRWLGGLTRVSMVGLPAPTPPTSRRRRG
jgi:hypothetical protein